MNCGGRRWPQRSCWWPRCGGDRAQLQPWRRFRRGSYQKWSDGWHRAHAGDAADHHRALSLTASQQTSCLGGVQYQLPEGDGPNDYDGFADDFGLDAVWDMTDTLDYAPTGVAGAEGGPAPARSRGALTASVLTTSDVSDEAPRAIAHPGRRTMPVTSDLTAKQLADWHQATLPTTS